MWGTCRVYLVLTVDRFARPTRALWLGAWGVHATRFYYVRPVYRVLDRHISNLASNDGAHCISDRFRISTPTVIEHQSRDQGSTKSNNSMGGDFERQTDTPGDFRYSRLTNYFARDSRLYPSHLWFSMLQQVHYFQGTSRWQCKLEKFNLL